MASGFSPTDAEAGRLRRAVLMLARRLRPALQQGGLSGAKLSVIGLLHREGPLTPSELAARERVKLASLTRLLAELEDDGWLIREAHASDGRRSVLRLTPVGKKRLLASARDSDAMLAAALAQVVQGGDRQRLNDTCIMLEAIAKSLEGQDESA